MFYRSKRPWLRGLMITTVCFYLFTFNYIQSYNESKQTQFIHRKSNLMKTYFNIRKQDEGIKKSNNTIIPATAVPPSKWKRYDKTWNGYTLPVMTAYLYGRFGNNMGEYASLFAMHKIYNMSAVLRDDMYEVLSPTFPNISIPRMPVSNTTSTTNWLPVDIYGIFNYSQNEEVAAGLLGPGTFVMTGFPFEMQLFQGIRDDILKEFSFAHHLQSTATEFLRYAAKQIYPTANSSKIIYIGFHIRATDYKSHVTGFQCKYPEDSYYRESLKLMRSKHCVKSHCIFILASDDMDFVKEKFSNITSHDIYFSNITSGVQELCMLSTCNHTIITQGTFGFWGAYLGGGDTIYADGECKIDFLFSKERYEAAQMHNFHPLKF